MQHRERRHSAPTQLHLTASLRARGEDHVVRIANLSIAGASIIDPVRLEPGELVQVTLHDYDAPITLEAVVLPRSRAATQQVALSFRDDDPVATVLLTSLVARMVERQRNASDLVLLVGVEPRRAAKLERDLASHGRVAVCAATPVETLWSLEDRSRRFDTVVVDFDRNRNVAIEILT